jgi:radical SAM superfamily enzyme YgiQ (UPF0313 family)
MRVLLISTYELGHQPLAVAAPAGALLTAGNEVRALDLSVETLDPGVVMWADRIAISVPMHTAMRLAAETLATIRTMAPTTPVALYGLYAGMGMGADVAFVGEFQTHLVEWASGKDGSGVVTDLSISPGSIPARQVLPGLDRYGHLQFGADRRRVGYVEASRGCRHRCRHCPIPVVYDGVYRVVAVEQLVADVDRLVDLGAEHLTFGDPDFLNGPVHAMRVLRAAHAAHPGLTFDVTIKVEHLLRHVELLSELGRLGVIFVTSAFETTHDPSLVLLDKGHTAADLQQALAMTRAAGLEIHPSWMPFMPWTEPAHVLDIFRFLDRHDLLGVTDPVQMSIRLLVPEGSLLIPVIGDRLGDYDRTALTYRWHSVEPAADDLQRRLATLAAHAADAGGEPVATLVEMWGETLMATGDDISEAQIPAGATLGRPRMTEPWFC